jgi:hypothetical protein
MIDTESTEFTLEDARACGWFVQEPRHLDQLLRAEKSVGGRMVRLAHPSAVQALAEIRAIEEAEERRTSIVETKRSEWSDDAQAFLNSYNEALANALSALADPWEKFDLRTTTHADMSRRRAVSEAAFTQLGRLLDAGLSVREGM